MKAYETELIFSGVTSHAVIVEFGKPWRLVFWARAQYVGCWDLGKDVWFTSEWVETNSPEDLHCYEPIMDKKLKYSKVEIMESGDARAKVHWHYACNDMRYRVFHGNTTADEYYTVYPDGVAVRKVVMWPGNESDHGGNPNFWQMGEFILINGKGTTPEQNLQKKEAFTFQNESGEKISFKWPLPSPLPNGHLPLCAKYPKIAKWNTYIGRVHVVNRPNPYVIFPRDKRLFPFKPCAHCKGDHPYFGLFQGKGNTYKHWPVTLDEDFILATNAGEDVGKVATHSSFLDINYSWRDKSNRLLSVDTPPRPTSWLFLTGATEEPSSFLIDLAKSWLNPAKIETGFESGPLPWGMSSGRVLYEGYAYSERAYVFRKYGEDLIEFAMKPQVPVINPVYIINGWKSKELKVMWNNEPLSSNRFKSQLIGDDLILWVNQRVEKPAKIKILS